MMPTSCATISMSCDLAERREKGRLLKRASTSVTPLMVLHTSATSSDARHSPENSITNATSTFSVLLSTLMKHQVPGT